MKKLLLCLLSLTSVSAFAQIGDNANTNQDYQKIKMYNDAKDNACLWQGGVPYPQPDATDPHGEVATMSVFYKSGDNDDWSKAPYLKFDNISDNGNTILQCSTATRSNAFSYRKLGYAIFSNKEKNTEITLKETPPNNSNPTAKGNDNIVTYSVSTNDEQIIDGKKVVCTISGTGTVLNYTKESFILLCEDK